MRYQAECRDKVVLIQKRPFFPFLQIEHSQCPKCCLCKSIIDHEPKVVAINATCPRVSESSKTVKRLIKLIAVFSWRHGVSSNIKFRKFPCHKLLKQEATTHSEEDSLPFL